MSMDPNMIRMMLAQGVAPQGGATPQQQQARVSPMSGAGDIAQKIMLMRALQQRPQQQQPMPPLSPVPQMPSIQGQPMPPMGTPQQ